MSSTATAGVNPADVTLVRGSLSAPSNPLPMCPRYNLLVPVAGQHLLPHLQWLSRHQHPVIRPPSPTPAFVLVMAPSRIALPTRIRYPSTSVKQRFNNALMPTPITPWVRLLAQTLSSAGL
jgi:hypothetical protein